MAVEGTLDLFKLPEILQLIAQQRKTGILTIQGLQDIVAISFLNGGIVAADALNQTLEEGLTRVLVAEGILTQQEMARAVSEHQGAGGRLLDLLVERGYVARPRLLEALRLQTFRLIEQLLRWDEGDFKFYSGDEVSYEEAFVPISVEELLLRSAQEAVDRAPQPRPVAAPRAIPPPVPPPAPERPPERPVRHAPAAPAARPAPAPAAAREPAPLPAAFRKMKVEQAVLVPSAHRLAARLLALLAAALLVAALLTAPELLLLPFPWQDGQRLALASGRRSSLYLKIDRAAKTFFLLEGRFPENLSRLRAVGLLAAGDLRDTQGSPLRYSAREESYTVRPAREVPGAESTEAITGNFLLDPEFLSISHGSEVPLVLLD